MAFSINSLFVATADPVANRNSSGVAEQRGGVAFGRITISSYGAGEVVPAGSLGLAKVYNMVLLASDADTYACRAAIPGTGNRSVTIKVDTAGSGTEVSSTTNIGDFAFVAWGEMLGSGTN